MHSDLHFLLEIALRRWEVLKIYKQTCEKKRFTFIKSWLNIYGPEWRNFPNDFFMHRVFSPPPPSHSYFGREGRTFNTFYIYKQLLQESSIHCFVWLLGDLRVSCTSPSIASFTQFLSPTPSVKPQSIVTTQCQCYTSRWGSRTPTSKSFFMYVL
jgi:hypothetical protein